MTVTQLPLVDFGQFLHGNADQRQQAAKKLVDSFVNHGFVRLKNHGISRDFVQQIWEWVPTLHVFSNHLDRRTDHPYLTRIGHSFSCQTM
jgi:isopenicillin N synthase-like dioxygenase